MKKALGILVVILFLQQTSFAQKIDTNLVTKKTELNFIETKMRGIVLGKMIYYVEKDLQNVSAYENGKLKWRTNVISVCGKPRVGIAEIRCIKLKKGKLLITFGKHSWAEIDTENGKTEFVGSD